MSYEGRASTVFSTVELSAWSWAEVIWPVVSTVAFSLPGLAFSIIMGPNKKKPDPKKSWLRRGCESIADTALLGWNVLTTPSSWAQRLRTSGKTIARWFVPQYITHSIASPMWDEFMTDTFSARGKALMRPFLELFVKAGQSVRSYGDFVFSLRGILVPEEMINPGPIAHAASLVFGTPLRVGKAFFDFPRNYGLLEFMGIMPKTDSQRAGEWWYNVGKNIIAGSSNAAEYIKAFGVLCYNGAGLFVNLLASPYYGFLKAKPFVEAINERGLSAVAQEAIDAVNYRIEENSLRMSQASELITPKLATYLQYGAGGFVGAVLAYGTFKVSRFIYNQTRAIVHNPLPWFGAQAAPQLPAAQGGGQPAHQAPQLGGDQHQQGGPAQGGHGGDGHGGVGGDVVISPHIHVQPQQAQGGLPIVPMAQQRAQQQQGDGAAQQQPLGLGAPPPPAIAPI